MSKEHYLIIDTDQYSGNFEREMAGFVFGGAGYDDSEQWEEYQKHWTDEERKAVELFSGNDELEGIMIPQIHDEYGPVMVQITQTPRDLLPESEKSHGYCSFQVQIMPECWDQVTPEVIARVKDRCRRFCEIRNKTRQYGKIPVPMYFLGLRHQTREIIDTFVGL